MSKMFLTTAAAFDTIEETLLAITDSGAVPFLKLYPTHNGWVAHIADPNDPETPFYGHGPCTSSEAAIVGLAEHILAHA